MDTGKLIDSMKRVVKSELGSYDTTATVKRVEGNTAWVHIPGGVDETPVRLTMNAKEGDNVQVRVSDGKAFLAGNVSAPPTDDTTAEAAKALANRAAEDAGRAKTAADIAESYATSAQASAAQSANILEGMEQAAIAAGTTLDGIYADAAEAKATTDEINDYADTAGKTVTQILNDGETAGAAASAAQQAADTALVNLATTEDVVGVLNWITAHGTMVSQYGEVFDPDKVYFIVDPTGDYVVSGTHYSVVPSPVAEDIDSYYILNISESVQNYVATHIVVDSEGLWIIPDAGGNKVLIATGSGSTYTTAGTYIVGKVGGVDAVLAEFTASGATVGLNSEGNTVFDSSGVTVKQNGSTLASFTSTGAVIGENVNGMTRAVIDSDSLRLLRNVANNDIPIVEMSIDSSGFTPYFTLGRRQANSTIGDNSTSLGAYCEASGNYSYAEGNGTVSSNYATHSEGMGTTASGFYAHAQNQSTIASGTAQTALGTFNVEDTSATTTHPSGLSEYKQYAVIVGNGTSSLNHSNALTVDWSGNVEAAGDVTDGSGNTLSAVAVNDIISLKPSGNITRSGTGDSRVTSYTTITSNGSKLTNNGGVKIGSGVSLIKVCYGLAINTTGTNHILNAQLYKNSTQQSVYGFDTKQAQSGRGAISFPPTLMSVSSGDVIDIGWYGQTGDTLYANGTTLTVEVVK